MESTSCAGARHSLIDLLRRSADEGREAPRYRFVGDGPSGGEETLSCLRLEERARGVAATLQETLPAGERCLLLFPPGLELLVAFFGALMAGVFPVLAPPPRKNRNRQRVLSILEDARPTRILTLASLEPRLVAWRDREGLELPILCTDRVDSEVAALWRDPGIGPEDVAFLQYTSGSTSAPKGVVLTHGNLLENSRLIHAAFAMSRESHVVSWLPPYHDMGLIGGILQPLYAGCPATLMSPMSFLRRPRFWLEILTETGATTSGGPNFAYELCLRRIPPEQRAGLDLARWRTAFNGAEPVRASTLRRFSEAFAPVGFREESWLPCYGLAEATLIVTGAAADGAPRVRSFDGEGLRQGRVDEVGEAAEAPGDGAGAGHGRPLVSCGTILSGGGPVIVEPETGRRLPEGAIGEIWVSGPSAGRGYWRRPEESRQTFGAVLAGGDAAGGGFLRTGDLGFSLDGELFVAGRLKDLIILRGRNHYPQDLEATAEGSHPDLRPGCGAAFSVDLDGEERLVLVQEVERHPRDGAAAIVAAIRDALARAHEVRVHEVILARPGAVPRTTSGKVQRAACRELYRAGRLEVYARHALPTDLPESEDAADSSSWWELRPELPSGPAAERRAALERDLVFRAAHALGTGAGEVDPARPLTAAGLDSLAAVELQASLEGAWGRPVSLRRLLEGATPRELAAEMLGALEAPCPPAARAGPVPETERGLHVGLGPGSEAGSEPERPSEGQRALWLLEQTAPGNGALNLALVAEAPDGVDGGALRRSLEALAARHGALRTTFHEEGGEPRRYLHERLPPAFEEEEAGPAGAIGQAALLDRLAAFSHRPFDLAGEPPLRVSLHHHPSGAATVAMVLHHLAGDFWSASLLLRELGDLYTGEVTGEPAALSPPAFTYDDYLRWHERRLASSAADADRRYWHSRLEGATGALELVTDRPRPASRTFRADSVSFTLDEGLAGDLVGRSRRSHSSLFALLLASWEVLLARVSGSRAFAVGTATADRSIPEARDLVGYLVNPVALPVDLVDLDGDPDGDHGGDPGFLELLERVRGTVLEALDHRLYPFPRLVEELLPGRDPGRAPLFQTSFLLHRPRRGDPEGLGAFALGEEGVEVELGALRLVSRRLPRQRSEHELTLVAARARGRLLFSLRYLTELFDRTTALRLAAGLRALLEQVAGEPAVPISALDLLGRALRHQVVAEWNDTARSRSAEPLARKLERRARSTPDAVAVVRGSSRVSYGELDRRAEGLAAELARRGARPGRAVGLLLPREPAALAALLAIVKTGAAYVPLDPEQPPTRLAAMAGAAGVEIVVTRRELAPRVPEGVGETVFTDDRPAPGRGAARPSPDGDFARTRPLYVIFTSGSTGVPKGAVVYESGFVNLLDWYLDELGLDPEDRVLWISALGFDLTQKNLFATWLAGAELHLPEGRRYDPGELRRLVEREAVTRVNCTPSAFYPLLEGAEAVDLARLRSLRSVILGGEPVARRRLDGWLAEAGGRTEVLNTYGPTEATDVAAFHRLAPRSFDSLSAPPVPPVPVGRPLPEVRVRVLDRRGRPAPVGAPGEVVIAGAGVGGGYLGLPRRTAEAFRPDPWSRAPGARAYRTGDLARLRPDGRIEYRGRIDQQVKVRGHRIEPGEVETALREHPGVREAAVVARADPRSELRLVGYLVPDPVRARPVRALRALERAGRLDGRERIVLPNGLPVVHLNRSETQFLYHEIFEEDAYLAQGITLGPGAVVFDVGANIGLFDLYLARRDPSVRIYAFEPVPPIFEVLRLNLEIHDIPARAFGHGLASAPGFATFEYFPNVSILSGRYVDAEAERETVRRFLRTEAEQRRVAVTEEEIERLLDERLERRSFRCPLKTLSQVVRETGVERIDLLKVDVEKAELDVLEGLSAQDWSKVRQVVAEVHDLDGRLARITALLESQGFEVGSEREAALRDVPLFTLAARRPAEATAPKPAPEPAPAWADEAELVTDVRQAAAGRLPEPMVPSTFVVLDALP